MGGRILIVDDVVTNRILLKARLDRACYHVLQATHGREALAMARAERPNLILLDTALPDMDGISACRALRGDPETAAIPIVMTSAMADPKSRLLSLRAGAEDYLIKPLNEMTLLARVRSILRAQATEEELHLRDTTSRDLGFAESAGVFDTPARIALIGSDAGLIKWKSAAKAAGSHHRLEVISPASALNWDQPDAGASKASPGPVVPDVFIIPGDLSRQDKGLRMLSELRSRPKTRHAGIIMVLQAGASQQAVIALDLGANDLVAEGFLPEELMIRVDTLVRRKRRSDRLRNSVNDRLRQAAQDPLTGLFNRRYAIVHLARISDQAHKIQRPFAVMMLDIDRFKRVNDTWGHDVGDIVLKEVAERLRNNMRDVDLVARIGGEEFLIVMPDTDSDDARIAAERLRRIVEEVPVRTGPDTPDVRVTLSIGVSMGRCKDATGAQTDLLLRQADRALYKSKSHGRNTVSFCRAAA